MAASGSIAKSRSAARSARAITSNARFIEFALDISMNEKAHFGERFCSDVRSVRVKGTEGRAGRF